MDVEREAEGGTGSARRRRERRLRAYLKYARMSVAMALAESTHHSSRGQTNAAVGVWGREMNCTATIRDPLPPSPTPTHTHTHQPELFELSFEEEPGGGRPDRIATMSGPQGSAAHRAADRRCSPFGAVS